VIDTYSKVGFAKLDTCRIASRSMLPNGGHCLI
jgi:hypothetical protein